MSVLPGASQYYWLFLIPVCIQRGVSVEAICLCCGLRLNCRHDDARAATEAIEARETMSIAPPDCLTCGSYMYIYRLER